MCFVCNGPNADKRQQKLSETHGSARAPMPVGANDKHERLQTDHAPRAMDLWTTTSMFSGRIRKNSNASRSLAQFIAIFGAVGLVFFIPKLDRYANDCNVVILCILTIITYSISRCVCVRFVCEWEV